MPDLHNDVTQMFDLTDRVAVITGGARHLGFDAASVLAAAGCHVAITSRTLTTAQQSADKLAKRYGVDTLALAMEQTNHEQICQMTQQVVAWKGKIDVLVNNAGGGSGQSPAYLLERSPQDIATLIEVNLTGVLYCCREVGRVMVEQQSGKIINIASMAGSMGRDRRMYDNSNMLGQPVDYAAAKGGVIAMTMDLAGLLSPKGIYVNAISPGGFARKLPDTFVKDYSDRTPLGRMGRDGIDLNGAILFLASPASDYVTGHNLVVDGGFSIWH
jgi:NAD(P)-dependent dehydrogenase (short-subunit alcohol dehydrogenase family)